MYELFRISNSEVAFSLYFNSEGECRTLQSFDDGVEFSIHLSSILREWIPVSYTYADDNNENMIDIGRKNGFSLRGYILESRSLQFTENSDQATFTLCNFRIPNFNVSDYFQFRWLQTSRLNRENDNELWNIESVTITFVDCVGNKTVLLNESLASNNLK